jgi:hypothetical protein
MRDDGQTVATRFVNNGFGFGQPWERLVDGGTANHV